MGDWLRGVGARRSSRLELGNGDGDGNGHGQRGAIPQPLTPNPFSLVGRVAT